VSIASSDISLLACLSVRKRDNTLFYILINSCSVGVTDLLGDRALVNLKPTARKHHEYQLELPAGTQHKFIPASRTGYYGHDEYELPNGFIIRVSTLYGKKHAYMP